jgi:gliding motility-associated-like protein
MYKRWLLPIILILYALNTWADVPVTIRRICEDGADNHLFFTPTTDPCPAFIEYQIWGRNSPSGPFLLIGTITNKSQDEYTHVNASPGIATNWNYFIVTVDNCGPDFSTYSDTISVDRQQPQVVLLDSASIDPDTNEPHLGWHNNPSPDFSHFKVYSIVGPINTVLSGGQKDTFFHVFTSVSGPKKFNISSVDSCGNETPFITGAHTSMFLTLTSDTCLKETNLSWTPYIGWNGIRKYYIYAQKNGGSLFLIDSIDPTQTTLTHSIELGAAYKYYIRAFKDTENISASSNSVTLTTRLRLEPKNSYLTTVSVLKPNDPTVEIHIFNPNEEVKNYSIQSSETETGIYTEVGTVAGTNSNIQNYSLIIPFVVNQKYYKAIASNACGETFPSTNVSRYANLAATSAGNQNNLIWQPYFTWNSGVDFYNIYRGTNDDAGNIQYTFLDAVSNTDTMYSDLTLPERVGENGLCYYIEAVQSPGDINSNIETALSIQSCVLGEFKVFVPNAFHPFGANSFFRPEGSYIDYNNSQMEIYDRWGRLVISITGIRNGWNGKDSNGTLCMPGVYVYKIKILSTNGKTETVNGNVTLLN